MNAAAKLCSRFSAFLLVLSAILLLPSRNAAQAAADTAKIAGDWAATLSVDGNELHLALHIVAAKDGSLSSTVDSIDQGEFGTATTATAFKDSKLTFSIDQYHVTYEGTLNKDGSEITGSLTQGQAFPLNFKRAPAQSGVFSAVIGRLSGLRGLPDGVWKTHSGDVAHGEAMDLNESDWQPVPKDGKVGTDAVWLRQSYRVPAELKGYDLTGAKIWFHLNANADSPIPEILYFDGRRVAMGDDIEPVVMLEHAKPGDTVTVAMKMLHTTKVKSVYGATLRIEAASTRPDPEDLRLELLTATRLVPSLAPGDTSAMDKVNSAVAAVDVAALDAHDQGKFDASLKTAHERLGPLKPLLQQVTFHLTGQSHMDAAWLWPWTETVDVVKRTFGTALQLMYEYPQYTYSQSAAAYYEWMAQKYPDMNAEIAKRIKEGRWEAVGGMWVEPDLNLPDGESIVRQLLVGKRFFKQAYGVDVRIGWNPDSFGYTAQLPQIYKKSGVDYFVTTKMTWNDTNQLPFKLFWWQSPDGSKVLTYFPPGLSTDLNPLRESNDFVERRKMAPGTTEMMDIYGVGDHGGGPTRALLDEGFHWAGKAADGEDHIVPRYEFGLAQPFFSSIEKQIAPESPSWNYQSIAKGYSMPPAVPGKVSIPTWTSDLYLEYHRGIYTTQANHKRNMRDAEIELLDAEKWSSLAWLDGRAYPADEITEDWKKVLFNQFHDLAAGSGIGVIYKDAQKDYDVVRWSTNEISADALKTVAQQIDTSDAGKITKGQSVVVFNPLGWTRSGEVLVPATGYPNGFEIRDPQNGVKHESTELPVETHDGVQHYRVPVADVPALGYEVLQITAPAADGHSVGGHGPEARDESGGFVLENGYLRVVIDKKTGCITSLFDKHANFETLAAGACGNQLQAFTDKPKDYDAWNIDPGTLDQPPTLLTHPEKVELVGDDAVRVTQTWQTSKLVQTIRFDRMAPQVDIENDID